MTGIEIQGDLVSLMLVYVMASLRFLGLFTSLVIFAGAALPFTVRAWMSLVMALASASVINGSQVDLQVFSNVFGLVFASSREILIGAILGVLASSPLYALQIAGRFVSQQMGFAMADVMDPMSDQRVSVIGQLKYIVGTWFWFSIGGHLLMTAAVVESLKILPVGTPVFAMFSFRGVQAWITELFLLAVKMVLPYFGALLLAELGLGFIAKTIPQMNVFMLGFPIKILLGIFLLSVFALSLVKVLLPDAVMDFLMMFHLFFDQ